MTDRVLHRPEGGGPLLSETTQSDVRSEIMGLLANRDTSIGGNEFIISDEKHLMHKSIFILGNVTVVTREMYDEVSDHLGRGFSLRMDTLNLPKFGTPGKGLYVFIEYSRSTARGTLGYLFSLFVFALYVKLLLDSAARAALGIDMGASWTNWTIKNMATTVVMFLIFQVVCKTEGIALLYDVYYVSLKTSTHVLIGLASLWIYCVGAFLTHTWSDASMFGALWRVMGRQ